MRGRGKNSFKSFAVRAVPVTLSQIDANFSANDRIEGRFPRIKILGGGEITKKFIVSGCEISGSAKAAIEKAGGIVHA
jgi:ribosomal protein L15